MSGLDLDSLEKLLAEAKPAAPWREHKYGIIADGGDVVSWDYAWGENEHTEEWTLKPLIVAAVNALPALITRLRAAEARTAWADSLALQARSMATAIDQADEDGGLGALGPVTAAIIRSDVARMLEIVAERPAAPEAP